MISHTIKQNCKQLTLHQAYYKFDTGKNFCIFIYETKSHACDKMHVVRTWYIYLLTLKFNT